MKHPYTIFIAALSALGLAFHSPPKAEADYTLTWYTVDGGGEMFAQGGSYRLSGTIGQPDATQARALAGGDYTLTGGFWTPCPDPPTFATVACSDDLGCVPCDSCVGGQCEMHNNRYLSIVPPDTTEELGIKVTIMDGPCADNVRYAGPLTDCPEKNLGQPLGWFTCALLQETPVYSDMSTAVDGRVHLYGAEVAPETTYELRMIDRGGCESEALSIKTAEWGDVARIRAGPGRPHQPDFGDIAAIVEKFQGLAYLKAQTQLQPGVLEPCEEAVNFKDIGKAVDAFKGVPYPYACSAQDTWEDDVCGP